MIKLNIIADMISSVVMFLLIVERVSHCKNNDSHNDCSYQNYG